MCTRVFEDLEEDTNWTPRGLPRHSDKPRAWNTLET